VFISYAQNFEDIVLWRVLQHVESGTYVDVGAADPTEFSVTKAFYDRGWSGINVEPAPEFVEKLRAERSRDTTVAACAGAEEGTVTFHYVPGTGLSTVSDDYLNTIADHQFEVVDLEVEVQRLDRILEAAGLSGKDIHFLKVDVEGAEETVLRSIDLAVWRPWVLVVEATEPLSTSQTHESWDVLLTGSGYSFCLFDGLNRFYVADEHPELAPALSYPAGVFDQPFTVGAGDNEIAAVAGALLVERDLLLVSYRDLHSQYDAANIGYENLQAQYQNLLDGHQRLEREYESALEAFRELEQQHQLTNDGYLRLHVEYDNAVSGYQRLHVLYDDALAVTSNLEAELALRDQAIESGAKRVSNLETDLAAANARLEAIERSALWKLARPLRGIRRRALSK